MSSFVENGEPVTEKIFEGFLTYMDLRLSCDIDNLHVYIHWIPHPIVASHKIWL